MRLSIPRTYLEPSSIRITISGNKMVEKLFLFFCFFPYIMLVPIIKSDLQPYALLFSGILMILWIPNKIPKDFLGIFTLIVFTIVIFFFGEISGNSIRILVSYVSFLTVTYTTYRYLLKYGSPPYSFITLVVFVWFFVGLVQLFYSDFLNFMLARATGGGSRGVVSLAAEPSFYGIACIFFMLIIDVVQHPREKLLIRVLLFQVIFFAQSSLTIVFILIYVGLWILKTLNPKRIILMGVLVILIAIIIANIEITNFNVRILSILYNLITEGDIFKLLLRDASVNDRVAHIYFSFKGFFDSYFIPNSFSNWDSYLECQLVDSKVFWWVNVGGRIMSLYGGALYELGIFGLLIPISITVLCYKAYIEDPVGRIVKPVFLNLILLNAIPVSFPPLAFFLGCAMFRIKKSNENSSGS